MMHFLKNLFVCFLNPRGISILNGRDKQGNTVVFQRLLDTEPSKYDMDLTLKLSHMLSTIWQLENGTCKGTVLIYDQRGFGLSHMARSSISSLRTTIYYVQVHPTSN